MKEDDGTMSGRRTGPTIAILCAMLGSTAAADPTIAGSPGRAVDRVQAGLEHLHQGLYGEATRAFQDGARLDPADPEPPLFVAFTQWWRILFDDDDVDRLRSRFESAIQQAITLAEKRLDKDSADSRAMTVIGSAHILRAHVLADERHYYRAAREARRGKKVLEKAIEADPDRVEARFTLGAYNYYADKVPAIVKGLRVILFLPGGNAERGLRDLRLVAGSPGRFRTDARLLLAIIEGSSEEGCYGAALGHLRVALEENHGSPLIRGLIGELYMRLGQPDRALTEFHTALESASGDDPDRVRQRRQIRIVMADALISDWRLEEARRILDDGMLNMKGMTGHTLKDLHRVRLHLGSREGSASDGPAALDAAGRAVLIEALAHQRAGRTVEAIGRLDAAVKRSAENVLARFVKARVLFLSGRYEEAIEEFESVADAGGERPGWMEGWTELYLGMARQRLGDLRQARGHFKRAAQVHRFEAADRAHMELRKLDGESGTCGI